MPASKADLSTPVPVAMEEDLNSKESSELHDDVQVTCYNADSNSPKVHYRNQLNEALTSTSINGLSQAFSKTKRKYQAFWVFVFFLSLVAFIINFESITKNYLKNPVLTQLERDDRPFTWPHFTFCSPANPIPFWESPKYFEKWKKQYDKAHTYNLPRYQGGSARIKIWEHYMGIGTINPTEFYSDVVQNGIFRFAAVFENASIAAFSSAADQFITISNFTHFFETRLDTIRSPIPCFTLIPDRVKKYGSYNEHSSKLLAIKIYLIMDAKSYMDFNIGFESRKLYFFVTKPNSTILSKFPYYILPGTDSTFLMNEKIHSRLSECTKEKFKVSLYDISMVNTRTFEGEFDDCRTFFSQKVFVERCHCYNPYLPMYKFENQAPILCTNMTIFDNAAMNKNIECLNKVISDSRHSHKFNESLQQLCSVYKAKPCKETTYSVTRFSTAWQTTMSEDRRLKTIANAKLLPNAKNLENVTEDFPRENLAILKLEWGREETQATYEQWEYPFAQYMSDFGGIVGLWIGLSVISVFEIVEILYKVVRYLKAPG